MPRALAQRPDVEVFAEVGMIDQLATTLIDRLLPTGLTSAQFAVLNHLATHGREETPASLVQQFVVSKGAMTNILQRLESRGLVTTEPDPADARRKKVSITAEGMAVWDASVRNLRPLMESLREAFTADEFQSVLPFLSALRDWLQESK
jgi:DNA-binding MarR family transcriptional regulator